MNTQARLWAFFSTAILSLLALTGTAAQEDAPIAMVLTFDGAVTPVMVQYMERGLRNAAARDAELLIFELNTPGGDINVTQDLVEVMRASELPIVVYVSPRGALAASAGTVITVAGHAAAMAPETAIGAASPVGGQGEDLGETISTKIKESLKATVRSLMEGRPPGAVALAEEAIEDARAASASEALESGLIDFIASDTDDLLRQLDGFDVETAAGQRTIRTAKAVTVPLPLSPLEQILVILTNPNIVFLLLTVGVQAILIELGSPGGWVPGFIGVVALALATYGLGVLPVNLFGLIFLGTAFVLFALEVKAPTKGALSLAGLASFVVGALVLFNSARTPGFPGVSIPLVIVTALFTASLIVLVLTFAIRAQSKPIRTGQESLVGLRGIARSELAPRGSVQVAGELWTAELAKGEQAIEKGTRIEVVSVEGVHLQVQRSRAPTPMGGPTA